MKRNGNSRGYFHLEKLKEDYMTEVVFSLTPEAYVKFRYMLGSNNKSGEEVKVVKYRA